MANSEEPQSELFAVLALNDSLGLGFWFFLVPLSAHKENVLFACLVQAMVGARVLRFANRIRYPFAKFGHLPSYMTAFEQKPVLWSRKLMNWTLRTPVYGLGAAMLLGAAADAVRTLVPYDPFREEALIQTKLEHDINSEAMIYRKEEDEMVDAQLLYLVRFIDYWWGPIGFPKASKDDFYDRLLAHQEPYPTGVDCEAVERRYNAAKRRNRRYIHSCMERNSLELPETAIEGLKRQAPLFKLTPLNVQDLAEARKLVKSDFREAWTRRVAPFTMLRADSALVLEARIKTYEASLNPSEGEIVRHRPFEPTLGKKQPSLDEVRKAFEELENREKSTENRSKST